jgi:TRAP-type C4-dicarboxylate transport system permease small subunit
MGGACHKEFIDFRSMEAGAIRPGYELWRPNREKAEAKSAKALVVFLLLVSAGISLVITIGGWERLEGGKIFALAYIAIYVLFAFLVTRWNRGCLPVASALAIILAIFAGIAAPAWFDRAKDGLESPALPEELLGLLTLLLVPVQVILIAVAMVAFNQDWHVEEERQIGDRVGGDNEEDEEEPPPLPERMRRRARRNN